MIAKINELIDPLPTENKMIQLHFSHSSQHIQTIYKSIQNSRVIKIRYVDHQANETERAIEPMGIYLKDFHRYIWAYCLLRNGLRVFKLTRIIEIQQTDDTFNRRPYVIEDVDANREQPVKSETLFTAYLQFNSSMRAKVLDDFQEEEIINNQDGTLNVVRDFYTMEQAISQILRYGIQVRIIYPRELMTAFIKHIEEIKQLYKD